MRRRCGGNIYTRVDLEKLKKPRTTLESWFEEMLRHKDVRDDEGSVKRMLYRFVAGVSYRRDVLKTLTAICNRSLDVLEVVAEDLCDSIRFSAYAKRVQRALHQMLSRGFSLKCKTFAKKWAVWARDVRLTANTLEPKDKRKLRGVIKTMDFAPPLTAKSIAMITQNVLMPYAKTLLYKLRFVAKYDQGKSLEDLSSDLVREGLRTLIHYDHMVSEYKLLNFVRRCMHNFRSKIIKHETHEDRRRVVQVNSWDRVYQATSISMDGALSPDSEGNEHTLHDVMAFGDADTAHDMQAANVLYDALSRMTSDISAAFLIGLGRVDSPDFDAYLATIPGSEDFDVVKRTKLAVEFSGHSWRAVKSNLACMLA